MRWNETLPEALKAKLAAVDTQIAPRIHEIEEQVMDNQAKVLKAFQDNHVSEAHFAGTNGYGNDDDGRDVLEQVYANVFHTEAAIVRPQFVSGTHTIATALFGMLRPGDSLLYATGKPYDTLQEVIGIAGNGIGSLLEYQVNYADVPLNEKGKVDLELLREKLADQPKVVAIQRSRGYAIRDSFTVDELKPVIALIKEVSPASHIFVDNCYGEFSETIEPTDVGADIMAGSLIKNAGGGIAQTGGYLVGKKELIEQASYRLTAPGIGNDEGATLDTLRTMFQGFFLAPHVTGEAIKSAIFEAALLSACGLSVQPAWDAPRTDLIQSVNFGNPDDMIAFTKHVQEQSPVDSFVSPVPSEMAGYEDKIIMAAGTFVQGASVEFSADGPIRAPYTLYIQGGLTYEHVRIAITNAVNDTFYQK